MTFNEQIDKINKVFYSCTTKEQLAVAHTWCDMCNYRYNKKTWYCNNDYFDISEYIDKLYYTLLTKLTKE